jgi:hypothetical protein
MEDKPRSFYRILGSDIHQCFVRNRADWKPCEVLFQLYKPTNKYMELSRPTDYASSYCCSS